MAHPSPSAPIAVRARRSWSTLSRRLLEFGRMDAEQVVVVASRHRVPALVRPEGYLNVPGYELALGAAEA